MDNPQESGVPSGGAEQPPSCRRLERIEEDEAPEFSDASNIQNLLSDFVFRYGVDDSAADLLARLSPSQFQTVREQFSPPVDCRNYSALLTTWLMDIFPGILDVDTGEDLRPKRRRTE